MYGNDEPVGTIEREEEAIDNLLWIALEATDAGVEHLLTQHRIEAEGGKGKI